MTNEAVGVRQRDEIPLMGYAPTQNFSDGATVSLPPLFSLISLSPRAFCRWLSWVCVNYYSIYLNSLAFSSCFPQRILTIAQLYMYRLS